MRSNFGVPGEDIWGEDIWEAVLAGPVSMLGGSFSMPVEDMWPQFWQARYVVAFVVVAIVIVEVAFVVVVALCSVLCCMLSW